MEEFHYQIIDPRSERKQGSVQARSRSEALRQLTAGGNQVLSLEPAAAKRSEKKKKSQPSPNRPTTTGSVFTKLRLTRSQLIVFTEELGNLLHSGFQLEPALNLIENRQDLPALAKVGAKLRNSIREGTSLSSALKEASPSFDALYINLVAAGEASGSLSTLLERHAQYLTRLQELKNKVVTAMIYPAFLLVAGLVVTILFVTFLIPKLLVLIEATGSGLPPIIQIVLGLSAFLKKFGIILLIGMIVLGFAVYKLLQSPSVKPTWHRFKTTAPIVGKVSRATFQVHFLRTLGNLLENGLSLVDSLQLTTGITENHYLRQQLASLTDEVIDGASFWSGIEKRRCFPKGLADYVKMSEQTGNLNQGINKAAERSEKQLEKTIERITVMIQPAIIAVMAGVVGFMAYLMIGIIYNTISILQTS